MHNLPFSSQSEVFNVSAKKIRFSDKHYSGLSFSLFFRLKTHYPSPTTLLRRKSAECFFRGPEGTAINEQLRAFGSLGLRCLCIYQGWVRSRLWLRLRLPEVGLLAKMLTSGPASASKHSKAIHFNLGFGFFKCRF